uniref:Uncharacterized protein n=1 Tax=Janibacter limosus TaxID=53458 RepID=A0AC61U3V2_9MICO|nr:hypothetical protein [Janibacter limosus]
MKRAATVLTLAATVSLGAASVGYAGVTEEPTYQDFKSQTLQGRRPAVHRQRRHPGVRREAAARVLPGDGQPGAGQPARRQHRLRQGRRLDRDPGQEPHLLREHEVRDRSRRGGRRDGQRGSPVGGRQLRGELHPRRRPGRQVHHPQHQRPLLRRADQHDELHRAPSSPAPPSAAATSR